MTLQSTTVRHPLLPLVITCLIFAVPSIRGQEWPCAECHEDAAAEMAVVVHAGLECLDCHPGADVEETHGEIELIAEPCAGCHDDAAEEFERSVHGTMTGIDERFDDECATCHAVAHQVRPVDDPQSPVNPVRLAETCGSCHADPEFAAELGVLLVRPLEAYTASVHARSLLEGKDGATCSDCHGAHAILPAGAEGSSVHWRRLAATCSRCHQEIAEEFAGSVHGRAIEHGIDDAPTCTDCHGEHRILDPHHEDSPVYATNIPKMTCGRCHGDLRLSEKFGIDPDKVPAYADSFHGLASRSGSVTVANCSSCHGIHDILPSTDPQSHTHTQNLAATCGQCHTGAGQRFAIGPVHVVPNKTEHVLAGWIRRVYLMLIAVVIGAMSVHNGLDLLRKAGRTVPARQGAVAPVGERLSKGFRIAHLLLAVGFLVLAYSGFALKYPESWWARPLLQWEGEFGVRGWLHRGAAILMLVAAAWHVFHLAIDRGARRCIRNMLPHAGDWRELRQRTGYLLARRPEPPSERWLGYAEKLEYLAVVWGMVIMGVTGALLWFDDLSLRWLPAWVLDVATVVHLYEAILASLAICVWHFYYVIFDPEVYPMDTAWLTGRSPRHRRPPEKRRRTT